MNRNDVMMFVVSMYGHFPLFLGPVTLLSNFLVTDQFPKKKIDDCGAVKKTLANHPPPRGGWGPPLKNGLVRTGTLRMYARVMTIMLMFSRLIFNDIGYFGFGDNYAYTLPNWSGNAFRLKRV